MIEDSYSAMHFDINQNSSLAFAQFGSSERLKDDLFAENLSPLSELMQDQFRGHLQQEDLDADAAVISPLAVRRGHKGLILSFFSLFVSQFFWG